MAKDGMASRVLEPIEPIEEPAPPVPAAAPGSRLLTFEDLPEEKKPRPGERVLLLGVVWGGSTLVELEQVWPGSDLVAGKLFDLPALKLPRNFPLVKHDGDGHVIVLPAEVQARVKRGVQVLPFARVGSAIQAPFRGHAYALGAGDRVVAEITPQLTLVARYVRAAPQRDKTLLETVDVPFASMLLATLFAVALFFYFVSRAPQTSDAYTGILLRNPRLVTTYQAKPLPPPPPQAAEPEKVPKDLSGVKEGDKSAGEEGKLGKPEAKKKEADPSRKGTPQPDPDKHARDLARVKKLGLVAALSRVGVSGGGSGAAGDVLGPGGLGSGINHSLGGTRGGAGLGDAYGVGGLGTRGTGPGGGGHALGIGGLGTKGNGHGRGGYGEVDLGGRGKDDTVFVPGRTTVVGGLSREVINRVIQKHYNEIKYCYEKELTKNPGLYGKIAVLFVIEGTGRVGDALVQQTTMGSEPVESCIVNHVRRWVFPNPQGGGTVQVTYPYVFKSAQ